MKRTLSLFFCVIFFISVFVCRAAAASAEDEGTAASDEAVLHVPQIRVVTENGNGTTLQKEDGYVNASIEITDTDGSVLSDSVLFKVRGNGTALASIQKKAFTFKFDKKREVLGLGKGKKWAMLANAMDTSLLRTYVTMELGHAMDLPFTSDHRMIELWVDDSFRGLYELIEPVQEGTDRVNIDIKSNDGMKDFLLEREKGRTEDGVSYIRPGGIRFAVSEPEEPTPEQLTYINNVMNDIVDKLKNGTQEEISAVLDTDSFAKFYILNEYVKTSDFDFSSVFFYYKDGKLYAGPPWDYDHSMGSCGDLDIYQEINGTEGAYVNNMHFYQYLCQYEWFMDEVREIYAMNRDYIRNIAIDGGQIDTLAEEYSAEIERNFTETPWKVTKQWSIYQKKPLPTYQENLDFFKDWCQKRFAWLDHYLTEEKRPYRIGDADGDDEVTIIDATVIQRTLADIETPDYSEEAADADQDGEVTVVDATCVQRYIAQLNAPEGIGSLNTEL